MEVNGTSVMRRMSDSWLNATQILKVAGVDKGKRTKVLDKEVQSGEHEKVQGGYGKYQGTWINYRRGVEFCRQYGVEEILRPLLEYDLSTDGTASTQNRLETPTKEQAMAAQRKRMYNSMDGRPPTQGSNGTYFKNMSSTAANAVNALSKTRFESPARGMDGRRSAGPIRPSQQFPNSQESMTQGGSQQSLHSMPSQDSFSANFADFPTGIEGQEPPRKRIRPSPQGSFMATVDPGLEISMLDGNNEPNDSFLSHQSQSFAPLKEEDVGLPPLPAPKSARDEQKKELLVSLFLDASRTDFSDHPAFLSLSGQDFEIPIDGSCNTALHWAATLARVPLVKQLVAKGFNICRTNSGGETALIAACQARNNYDHGTFPQLLELLGPSIEVRDGRGRTLLHHIAVSSAMQGRAAVGQDYLVSLLNFVVHQSSKPTSQPQSFDAFNYEDQRKRSTIGLPRFISEIVNAQDRSGDTALNLAARTSTTLVIRQLLEVGADPYITNNGGLAPVDFGVVTEPDTVPSSNSYANSSFQNAPASSQTSFADAQSEILSGESRSICHTGILLIPHAAIRGLFTASNEQFTNESREKQDELDKLNIRLRDESLALAEDRQRLQDLQAKARQKRELEQKIANLKRANADLRSELSERDGHLPNGVPAHVAIGEADKGLDFDGRLGQVEQLFPDGEEDIDPNGALSPDQRAFLSSMERAEVLRGRTTAYQQHNAQLESQADQLRSRSHELEERYRKIVSLCTGEEVDKVDEKLDSLLQAVMSDQKDEVELGKVRDFLRLVRDTE
jgi:regulatory protein SWI6